MLIVSTKEFRANQGKYLDMAANGENIVLRSRRRGSFKLVPVGGNESLISKDELYSRIEHSLKQAKEGKVVKQHDGESVEEYLNRLLCTD